MFSARKIDLYCKHLPTRRRTESLSSRGYHSGCFQLKMNSLLIYFRKSSFSADGHICGSVHLKPAVASDESSLDLRELVLDVPQGSAVLLRRKVS